MHTLEPLLAEHVFFKGMDEKYLSVLVGCASNRRFEKGEYLIREGQPADQFFLIRKGNVAVEVNTPDKGPVTLQTIGEGEILGWSWLVPPYRWRFDARARETTLAFALDAKCLRQKCEADHGLGYELLRRFALVMSQRLEAARLQVLNIHGPNA